MKSKQNVKKKEETDLIERNLGVGFLQKGAPVLKKGSWGLKGKNQNKKQFLDCTLAFFCEKKVICFIIECNQGIIICVYVVFIFSPISCKCEFSKATQIVNAQMGPKL